MNSFNKKNIPSIYLLDIVSVFFKLVNNFAALL